MMAELSVKDWEPKRIQRPEDGGPQPPLIKKPTIVDR